LDYEYNYGWVGEGADSAYNSETLTALVIIPAIDNFHKGEAVNTICFKVTLDLYSEAAINSTKEYKKKEKITSIRKLGFED
jgi:hypothetical protein